MGWDYETRIWATPAQRRCQMSKHANRAEREHMNRVANLGCICCRQEGLGWVPANLHHIREGYGLGQRASHFEVIPLCEGHHQGLLDTGKLAFHRGPRVWRERYGSERELLDRVLALLELEEGA